MVALDRRRLQDALSTDEFRSVVSQLHERGYKSLSCSIQDELDGVAGLGRGDIQILRAPVDRPSWSLPATFELCDLFFPSPDEGITLYLRTNYSKDFKDATNSAAEMGFLGLLGSRGIEAGCLARGEIFPGVLDAFCQQINEITSEFSREKPVPQEWETAEPKPPPFDKPKRTTAAISTEEVEAALALNDRSIRAFLWELNKRRTKRRNATEEPEVPEGVDLAELAKKNLVSKERVIACRKSNRVLAAQLGEDAGIENLTCPDCGGRFSDEKQFDRYRTSELAESLTTHGRWLAALTYAFLRARGLSDEDIIVEHAEGADEIDVIANVSGRVLVLELKDKDYAYGKAALFVPRFKQHAATAASVICTGRIDDKAKEFLAREGEQSSTRIELFEDPLDVGKALGKSLLECEFEAASEALSGTTSFINANLWQIALSRLIGGSNDG